jgi:hypothetical protein
MSEELKFEVFVCIHECTYQVFQNTLASDYFTWCNTIRRQLVAGNITPSFEQVMETTSENLHILFGLQERILNRLIVEFFIDKEYDNTKEFTRISKTLFGGYILTKTNNKFKFKTRKKRVKKWM